MEINYIREFVSLTETGSLQETAQKQQVTTSSLSRHMKVLEDEIGLQLFDRSSRKLTLSLHGKMFLPYAREFVRVDDERRNLFQSDIAGTKHTFTVGTIPLMQAYGILDLMEAFHLHHPDIHLQLEEGESKALPELLHNGTCDFAFIRDRDDPENQFSKIPFEKDRLAAVLSKDHALARQTLISIEQLRGEPLLLIGKNTFLYTICLDLCKKAGFPPIVAFTSHRAENLIKMAEKHQGIALLMEKPAVRLLTENLRLIPILPETTTQIDLAWRSDRGMTDEMKRFMDIVQCKQKADALS